MHVLNTSIPPRSVPFRGAMPLNRESEEQVISLSKANLANVLKLRCGN
jgi:hypothetical protein